MTFADLLATCDRGKQAETRRKQNSLRQQNSGAASGGAPEPAYAPATPSPPPSPPPAPDKVELMNKWLAEQRTE